MPKRATMNISLPPAAREWIADRVSEGHYASASEYVRELVRQDREQRSADRVDALLLEGLDSGPSKPFTARDWKRIRAQMERRIAKNGRRRG
jgi:antitoxin ParD1/3/4